MNSAKVEGEDWPVIKIDLMQTSDPKALEDAWEWQRFAFHLEQNPSLTITGINPMLMT